MGNQAFHYGKWIYGVQFHPEFRSKPLDPSIAPTPGRIPTTAKMGIDATAKGITDGRSREWPPDIVMSEEIKTLVDHRWKEYGF